MKRFLASLVVLWLLIAGGTAHSASLAQQLLLNGGCPYGASLFLNFAQGTGCGGTIAGSLSVARATPPLAYAQKLDGTLVGFAPNTLRLVDTGALFEEARTNTCIQSQTFDNVAWVKTDITVTADQSVAPDGTTTADLITEGSAGTAILSSTAGTITASSPSTGSVYIKKGNTQWIRVLWGTGSNRSQAWFDLTNGAVGTVSLNTGSATAISATISSVANGFFRLTLTSTNSTDITGSIFFVSAASNGSSTRVNGATYTLWGGQGEVGSFVTSYIPTTTVAVTRAADVISLTGPAAAAALNAKAAFFQTSGVAGGLQPRFFDNGSVHFAYFNSTTQVLISPDNSHSATASLGSGTYSGVVKTSFGFDASGVTAVANGGAMGSNATSWGTLGTPIILGNRAGGDRALNGYMQRFALGTTKGQFDGLTTLP